MAKVRRFVSPEQAAYAHWLAAGVRIGMIALVATFILYVSGYPPAHVSLDTLPRYWGLPAASYLAAIHARPGWGWLELVGGGDYLNFVSIAFLISVTMICYARILVVLLRDAERIGAGIVMSQLVVLVFAASGIFIAS